MNKIPFPMTCIACSVFRTELEALQKRGDIYFPVRYLNSALHMHPAKLGRELDVLLKTELKEGKKVLLLYGDCHAHMYEQEAMTGVVRVRGSNCAEILLGQRTYSSLCRQGVFFLLPEWLIRWREIFQTELGLNEKIAKTFMQEMLTKFVYLDTGLIPVPIKQLRAISAYSDLPWEILKVSPDNLLAAIRQAVKRLRRDEHYFKPIDEKQLPVFQAMAIDILEKVLSRADNPHGLSLYLTRQLRKLTGVRTAILLQCLHSFGGCGHRAACVNPDRRRHLAESGEIARLAELSHHLAVPEVWDPKGGMGEPEKVLAALGCDMSIAVPLNVGTYQVGVLLLLGVPDPHNINQVLKVLDMLSTIIALVFRNSLLYEKQEEIIEERTCELKKSENLFRTLAQTAPVGIFHTDSEGRYLYVNEQWGRMTGFSSKEACGKYWYHMLPFKDKDSVRHYKVCVLSDSC